MQSRSDEGESSSRSLIDGILGGGAGDGKGAALRTLLAVAALMLVVEGLRLGKELILPFLVAVFLSFLAAPPVLSLERKYRWPAWAAVLVVVTGVLGLLIGFSAILGGSVREFSAAMPVYKDRLVDQARYLAAWLAEFGVEVSMKDLYRGVQPGQVMDLVGSTLNGVVVALTNTALVVLTMVFILLEVAGFSRKIRSAFDEPELTIQHGARIAKEIQRYLALKTLISIGTGATVALLIWVMGVDFPVLWGVLAFFLNFIPNVGSVFAAIPAMLVALVMQGPTTAVVLGGGYVVINTVFGNAVEPRVMGDQLGLSPLVVFVSLVVWGWIWGPIGMLLSVPLTMVIKILFEQSEDLRWIAVLLGNAPPKTSRKSKSSSTTGTASES